MATAKVFKSGNSQAVRLPKEFRFDSSEVEIFRRNDEVILRDKPRSIERILELFTQLPPEIDERDNGPPQDREGL